MSHLDIIRKIEQRHPGIIDLIDQSPTGDLRHLGPVSLVFNNWGVVVGGVLDHRPAEEQATIISAFEETTYKAHIEVIREVQSFFVQRGLHPALVAADFSPNGRCLQTSRDNNQCHPLKSAKDTCRGCAKSYIANSYHQPSRCKPQMRTGWQTRMADYLDVVITANGGVSNTAPLTTIPGGGVQRIEPTKKR